MTTFYLTKKLKRCAVVLLFNLNNAMVRIKGHQCKLLLKILQCS